MMSDDSHDKWSNRTCVTFLGYETTTGVLLPALIASVEFPLMERMQWFISHIITTIYSL